MNYSDLKAAVAAYTHRDDTAAMMPTYVQLAEQRIYVGEANTPPLRIAAMVQTTTLTSGTGLDLPAGFLEAKRIRGTDTAAYLGRLEYQPLDRLLGARKAFSYVGNTLALSDDQSLPVELIYFGRFATPAADANTNWLLTNAPAVYLSAVLIEAAKVMRDDELLAREVQNYTSAMAALRDADKAAQHSGAPLRISSRTPRPRNI